MSDYPGLYKAVVVDNNDPESRGRVVVQCPQVLGNARSTWCEAIIPQRVYTPQINDIVYVQFLNGDVTQPVYSSTLEVDADIIKAHSITAEELDFTPATDADISAVEAQAAAALAAAVAAQGTADGKITTFYAASTATPTATATGDLWVVTDQGNKLKRWNGSAWVDIQDTAIQDALTAAGDAQATADGKIVTFVSASTSVPTATSVGDLWIVTDLGNVIKRWDGSAWVIFQIGSGAIASGAILHTHITDGEILTPALASNSVTGDKIVANTITADKIDATSLVVSASNLSDGSLGAVVNVDSGTIAAVGANGEEVALRGTGFTVKGAEVNTGMGDGPVLVNFPTDGSPDIISGTLVASTLTVTGDPTTNTAALFRGNNFLDVGSTLTLQSKVSTPTGAPSVTSTLGVYTTTFHMPTYPFSGSWKFLMPGGVATDGTYLYFTATSKDNPGTEAFLCKSKLDGTSTGLAVAQVSNSTGSLISIPSTFTTHNYPWGGVCIVGSTVYVATLNSSNGDNRLVFKRYSTSTLASAGSDIFPSDGFAFGTTCPLPFDQGWPMACTSDGTNIFVAYLDHSSKDIMVRKYDTSGNLLATYSSSVSLSQASGQYVLGLYVGNADWGSQRFVVSNGQTNMVFTLSGTTLTESTNDEFPLAVTSQTNLGSGGAMGGYGTHALYWDGTRFNAMPSFNSADLVSGFSARKHSTINWTTESPIWWLQYSWYNSLGNETLVGPATSMTMGRRKWWTVTTPLPPTAESRIYVGRGTSQPASSSMYLQTTLTGGVTSFQGGTVSFSGTNPITTATMPAGTASLIESQALSPTDGNPSIQIGGDGTVAFDTVLARGTVDANTSSGNKPALRVGNPTSQHLRIDGNEIVAMNNDTTQGTFFLNAAGAVKATGLIQTGTNTVNVTATGTNITKSITFGVTFPSVPNVVATPNAVSPATIACSVSSVTTTGFNFIVNRSSGTGNMDFCWIASTG